MLGQCKTILIIEVPDREEFCPVISNFQAFGEFSFSFWFWNSMRIVSWLPAIPDDVTSVWSKWSIPPWMSVFFINGQRNKYSIWASYINYSFHYTKINPLKLIVTDAQTNFVQDLYQQLRSRVIMKQFSQAYKKQIMFFSIMYNIMDNLKYRVIFTLNVHRFGSMKKQNIEEPLPWLRTTCGVGLIADITIFCWIVCSFEMEFKFVTLVMQSFHAYLDGICWTQFFCYIRALDVGWVEHVGFLTIFRVREA